METSETPVPSAREDASPSTGGDFLLQLLQQSQPSPAFSVYRGSADRNSFGDGSMLHNRRHSNGSSAAESGGSSSFSRASSSSEACALDEEQERPRFVRASSAEASALDEEQARYQLHHDPAVAAMGPSHPVGEVRALANMYGNTDGDARRVLPFYDIFSHHQMDQNQLCQHPHLGLQQVPLDVSFPQPPSEHLLSFRANPLQPSLQNHILRPYSYPRLPYSDHTTYLYVPPPTFSHTGQLTSRRFQDSTALPHPAFDELKSFSNEGLINEETMASTKLLSNRSMQSVSLPMIEDGLATPSSQLYTQFGSIPVEMSQAKAGLNPAYQETKGYAKNPSDRFKGVSQHESLLIEASMSNLGIHACQNRTLEDAGAKVSSEMCSDGVVENLERHASSIDDAVTTTAPMIQKLRYHTDNGCVPEGIMHVSDAKMAECGCGTTKARLSKPQKGVDATRKGRIGSSLWVPVMKERKEEASVMENKKEEPHCNAMDLAMVSEDATNKEATIHKDLHQGWRSDKPNLPSGLPMSELVDSKTTRPSRNKASIRQGPLGLPSGSRVESAPSSATEQSKQALQLSPGADAVDMRMAEGVVASLKPSLDLSYERAEENAETLAKSLSRLESTTENEMEEEKASKSKHSISQILNSDGKKLDGFGARPMARFNRREPLNRLDARKCTSNLLVIYQSLIPLDDEEQRRKQLLGSLDELVMGIWPDARLYLFGSCANGFGVCNSDIDVCLSIEGKAATRSEVVCILADALKANHMLNVQALTHARVPIVKYSDPKTGISCDVCVNNMLAVVNTKLLHDYAQIDVRLRQLAFMVKHWAKCRQVNETYCGTLSSYAYVLMCIHFLQQRKPPVLPCLQEMEPTYRVTVGNIECAYYDLVDKMKGFGQKNKETLADLVTSFFDYWAFRHDYTHTVVSIRTGNFLSKVEKEWTRRIGNERHLICIEDPFETSHDLGRVVDKHSIRVLRDEFQRAARIMRQDANPCVALFEPYIRLKTQAA